MNRYPLWKYIVIAIALVFGMLYTLPNFFGEALTWPELTGGVIFTFGKR